MWKKYLAFAVAMILVLHTVSVPVYAKEEAEAEQSGTVDLETGRKRRVRRKLLSRRKQNSREKGRMMGVYRCSRDRKCLGTMQEKSSRERA